jgi:putative transcriptional regulator
MTRVPRQRSFGAEVIGALTELQDALRSGRPLEEFFTVRTVELDLDPRPYRAEDVRRVRDSLNLSQALFARFLGVDVKTVRSWEQGLRPPSPIARRFMDEIARSPDHWRERLRGMIREKGRRPVKS